MKLSVNFQPSSLNVAFVEHSYDVSTGVQIAREYVERDPYTGAYEITPSSGIQVLSTKNLRMTDDITINPVPQNYGLITWNGSFLTVS